MELKTSPFGIFEKSDTPLALHVRQHWMGSSSRDQRTGESIKDRLRSGQRADGSWDNSVAQTIENLFSLWLLDAADESTTRAVNWLMETDRPAMCCPCNDGGRYDNMFFHLTSRQDRDRLRRLRGLPFTPGCAGFVKTGAALFHALELHQGDKGRIRRACRTISDLFVYRKGRPCSGSCSMNLVLAVSADARRFDTEALALATRWMQQQQKPNGAWGKGIPFYESIYALSRFPQKLAAGQLERALAHAVKMQQRDGAWGRSDQQLKAFLLLPALRQAGLLQA